MGTFFKTLLFFVLLMIGLAIALDLGTAAVCRQSQILSLVKLLPYTDLGTLEELDAQIVETLRTVLLRLGFEKSQVLSCRFAALLRNLSRQGPDVSRETLHAAKEFALDCERKFSYFVVERETFNDYRCARLLGLVEYFSKRGWSLVNLDVFLDLPRGPNAYLDFILHRPEASPSLQESLLAFVDYALFTLDEEREVSYWAKEIARTWTYLPNLPQGGRAPDRRVFVYVISKGQNPDYMRPLLRRVGEAPPVVGLPLFIVWLNKDNLDWEGVCFGCEGELSPEAAQEIACQFAPTSCPLQNFAFARELLAPPLR